MHNDQHDTSQTTPCSLCGDTTHGGACGDLECPRRDTKASEAVERAVNRLVYAGMVLRYRTAYGHSFYLGWPGRKGVLRVSDHKSKERDIIPHIHGRLTLHEQSTPTSEEAFTKALSEALGRYLMKAPFDGMDI